MNDRHNLIAYLATIGQIGLLALVASAVCIWCPASTEVQLARVLGALAFISAAIAGLTGIAGTFKASGANKPLASTDSGDVNVIPKDAG